MDHAMSDNGLRLTVGIKGIRLSRFFWRTFRWRPMANIENPWVCNDLGWGHNVHETGFLVMEASTAESVQDIFRGTKQSCPPSCSFRVLLTCGFVLNSKRHNRENSDVHHVYKEVWRDTFLWQVKKIIRPLPRGCGWKRLCDGLGGNDWRHTIFF